MTENSNAVRKFLAIKHSWRGSYNRIFKLGNNVFQTLDPKTMGVTNAWEYKQILQIVPSKDDVTEFTMTVPKDGGLFGGNTEDMKFTCQHRTSLLTEMHRLRCAATNNMGRGMPTPIPATKITRTDQKKLCTLTLAPQGVIVHSDDVSGRLMSEYLYKDIKFLQKLDDDENAFILQIYGRGRTFKVEKRSKVMSDLVTGASELGLNLKIKDDEKVTLLSARAKRARYGNSQGLPTLAEFKGAKLTPKYGMPVSRRFVINEELFCELDAQTYGVVSARRLNEIFAIVQSWDDPQKVGIEYKDGQTRWYLCGERNAFIASLIDACRASEIDNVCINAGMPGTTGGSHRVIPRNAVSDETLESQFLTRISAYKPDSGNNFIEMIDEFNANVSVEGVSFASSKYYLLATLKNVLAEMGTVFKNKTEANPAVAIALLQAAKRLIPTQHGYRGWSKLSSREAENAELVGKFKKSLRNALCSGHLSIVYWALEVVASLICPNRGEKRDMEGEMANKTDILTEDMRELLVGLLENKSKEGGGSALISMVLLRIFESVMCSSRETTHRDIASTCLQMIAGRHVALLGHLQSKCYGVAESVSLLMRTLIVESPPAVVEMIKSAALEEAVVLKYFTKAMFAPNMEQRFVARYLCSLWMSSKHPASHDLLRRVVPPGLRHFLNTPNLSKHAVQSLEYDEEQKAAAKKKSKRLAKLRTTIQKLSAAPVHQHMAGENFTSFFLMSGRDHMLPDLIWNQQTRTELRSALEAELRDFLRERELAGKSRISWNHSEFEVYYPSLDNEIHIGDHYVRLLFDSSGLGDGAVKELRNPENFFECLYRRFLRESRASLKALCLRAMALVHEHHEKNIRPFEDIAYLLQVVGTTRHAAIRDRALLLLHELVKKKANAKLILRGHVPRGAGLDADRAFRMLIQLMCMAHTQEAKRSANLMQTSLLLTAGPTGQSTGENVPMPAPSSTNEEDANARAKWDAESKRRADDMAKEVLAAKEWKYRPLKAKKGDPIPDPVTVNSLKMLFEDGEIDESSPVFAHGMRAWMPLKLVPQLRWQLLAETGDKNEETEEEIEFWNPELDEENEGRERSKSKSGSMDAPSSPSMGASTFEVAGEGERVLSPKQIGLKALEILEQLVILHPAIDTRKAAVVPPPRAKRVLTDRTEMPLTHISQTILTAEPEVVDAACRLLVKVCEFNPRASSKLYLTGVYYMVMGYAGSNFVEIGKLLHSTHLKQHFRSEGRETLLQGGLLKSRSILGTMLPECMLCILENYGPERFAEVFLGNFDTPEVIWTYNMRQILIRRIDQHLATLRGRLVQNISTRYDLEFAPIPTVNYSELDNELWCGNYYLRNLCDEQRFPKWPIADPVALLKSALDGWRRERDKGKSDNVKKMMGEDEALKILNIKARPAEDENKAKAWEDSVRNSYRKLARKYHPDRNPQGRETFEKIQKAYELLSSARPSSLRGPDPINIHLLIRLQCILFRRFTKKLAPYKYAGYPMLMDALTSGPLHSLTKNTKIMVHASQLVYLTCLCCALNARELVRVDGVEKMGKLLSECMSTVTQHTPGKHKNISISRNILHTMAGLAAFEPARDRIVNLMPLIEELCRTTALAQAPKATHYSLETIARLTVDRRLQLHLLNRGFMLYAVPLLLPFDAALGANKKEGSNTNAGRDGMAPFQEKDSPEMKGDAELQQSKGGKGDNTQELANHSAKLAARALSRMGGYLGGSLKSPRNDPLRLTMSALLTPVLANKLKRKSPTELLKLLSDNSETATIIWNATMRKNLMDFAVNLIGKLRDGNEIELHQMGALYEYANLASELYVGGVYVRVYNEHPDTLLDGAADVADSFLEYMGSEFFEISKRSPGLVKKNNLTELIKHMGIDQGVETGKKDEGDEENVKDEKEKSIIEATKLLTQGSYNIKKLIAERGELRGRGAGVMNDGKTNSVKRVQMCLQGLLNVIASHDIYDRISGNAKGLKLIFTFLEEDVESPKFTYSDDKEIVEVRRLTLSVINALSGNKTVADGIASMKLVGTLLHVMRRHNVLSKVGNENARQSALEIILALCSSSSVVGEVLKLGGLIDCLAFLSQNVPEQIRVLSARILCKIIFDTMHGAKAMVTLSRIIPPGLVHVIREDSRGENTVRTYDRDHESPELIWNKTTRKTFRIYAETQYKHLYKLSIPGEKQVPWSLAEDFKLRYPSLETELFVGGVFIRNYLKDPKYALREPRNFLDELLRLFIGKSRHRVDKIAASGDTAKAKEDIPSTKAPAIGDGFIDTGQITLHSKEDPLLTPVTSAAVCLLKVRENLLRHIGELGYGPQIVQLLIKVAPVSPQDVVAVSCVRLLHQFGESRSVVQSIAKANIPVIAPILSTIKPLHPEAAFTLEVLKRIIAANAAKGVNNGVPGSSDLGGAARSESQLIGEALKEEVNLVNFLTSILEAKADGIAKLATEDYNIAKVHAIDTVKAMQKDARYGPMVVSMLADSSVWEEYRDQSHDLFVSETESAKRDYYLTYGTKTPGQTKMLGDGNS
jgi:DnaJ homolog subfamily C member 13